MQQLNFKDFNKTSRKHWMQKILEELRLANEEDTLQQIYPGFSLPPFYMEDDLSGIVYPETSRKRTSGWKYRSVHYINKEGDFASFQFPADDIELHIKDPSAFYNKITALIKDAPSGTAFHFSIRENLLSFIKDLNKKKNPFKGSLLYDPLILQLSEQSPDKISFEDLAAIFTETRAWEDFSPLTLSSVSLQSHSITPVQELAWLLSAGVEYTDKLSDLGIDPEEIIRKTGCSLYIDTHFYAQIAKIRAFRILWSRIASAYTIKDPFSILIHCTTTGSSGDDPHHDLIANTTQAMSAILGGCDSLTISGGSKNSGNDNFKRLFHNISLILKEEAFLDKTADPSGGSYYIEQLTQRMVTEAWTLFLEIEKSGGFTEAVNKKMISIS